MEWIQKIRKFLWVHPGHLFWVLLAYLPGIGLFSIPLTGDQKVYLSTALEMQERGSFLQPFLFGEPSYYKPPLQYWMTLLGWKVFGFNLWGALLPSVLCVILTAWLVGEIVYFLHEKRTFINAGLWFAAALGTVTFGTTAQMEIWICLFYTAAWWAALRFLASPRESRSWRFLYLAFAFAGILALVKSPLYSVFWVAGFFTYLIISGEWELFQERHLWGGLAVGIFLGALWYLTILAIDGKRFWVDYVVRESFEKRGGNTGTVLGLWSALFYFCFPFTLFTLPAVRAFWRSRHTGAGLRFLISWAWPPLLFFSLFPYRNKPYAFILVPLLAILADWGYFRAGRTRFFRGTVLLTGLFIFAFYSLLAVLLFRAEIAPLWVIAGFLALGLWSGVCASQDWMRGLALSAIVSVLLFRVTALRLGEQDIATLRALHAAHPRSPIAFLDESRNIWHERGLLSAALGTKIARLQNLEEGVELLQRGGMLALDEAQYQNHQKTISAKLLGRGDTRTLEETPWPRWKRRTKFPYKEFLRSGRDGIPDFEELTKREFRVLMLK